MNNSNLINLYSCLNDYNNVFRDDIKAKDLDDIAFILNVTNIYTHFKILEIKTIREGLLDPKYKDFQTLFIHNLNKDKESYHLKSLKEIDKELYNKVEDYIKDTYLKTEDLIVNSLDDRIYFRSEIELINQISLKHNELKNLELVVDKTQNYEKVIDSYNMILEYHDFLKNHISYLEPSSENSKLAATLEKMDDKLNSNLENFKQKYNLEPNLDFDR